MKNEFIKTIKKINRFIPIVIATFILTGIFGKAIEVKAYEEIDSIPLTVGYWGATAYTKGEATLDELAVKCGVHSYTYTWIDGRPAPGTTEATGVLLSDVMNYFEIDMQSVGTYNFQTLDANNYPGAWEQWTSSSLFGPRYSFVYSFDLFLQGYKEAVPHYEYATLGNPIDPGFHQYLEEIINYKEHPESHYNMSNFYDRNNATFLNDAWNMREDVPPMLALTRYSTRWEGDVPSSFLDFSNNTSNDRPVLMFGQTSVSDVGRKNMAKMVCKIHIWFNGHPTITTNLSSIEGEIGTTMKLTADVQTPDSFLTESVKKDLVFSSSDESIATIDENGIVTIHGEGTATINIIYGTSNSVAYTTRSIGVSGTDSNGNDDGDKDGNDDGDGNKGNKNGDGGGSGNSGNGSGSGSGDSNINSSSSYSQINNISEMNPDNFNAFINTSSEIANSVSGGGGSLGGSWKMYEVSESGEVLPEIKPDNPLMPLVAAIVIILFIGGIITESLRFYLQIKKTSII